MTFVVPWREEWPKCSRMTLCMKVGAVESCAPRAQLWHDIRSLQVAQTDPTGRVKEATASPR